MYSASILGLVIFATTAAFTPGPNNVMLTSSGATFGFRRTLPHILGIAAGIGCLSIAGGFGLAGLLAAVPQLHLLMKGAAILFLGYLAWRISTAGRADSNKSGRPLTFMQAAAFQMVNPKGVTLLASAIIAYSTGVENIMSDLTVMVPIFVVASLSSACTWCLFGALIGRLLKEDSSLRKFNIAMAMLLVASMAPIFLG
ncbi:MAG: LysE family translocator [Pseudomonadota bacterium]|nr:LysE family translocator [Pseudomonadota bacterium]